MSIQPETVSVIICTWNRAGQLVQTLQSLQRQRHIDPNAVEVIVVDNNSTDDTRSVVKQIAPEWALGTLRYAFEPRQGKQFALNRAITMASHDLLAFTDDDILFPDDWLAGVQRVFANADIELTGGKTLIDWPPGGPPPWFANDMLAILAGVDLGNERLYPAGPDYAPAGSNMVARRSLFTRVGAFSEAHFRHMDYEFGMRCNRAGVRMSYEPSLPVFAPVDANCVTRRYFRRWSFKAGIARGDGTEAVGRHWPAVPRWIYRQALDDALWLVFRSRTQPPSVAFSRQLRLWRALGTLGNAWHAWLRPASHARWVQRHSQKKQNVY